MSIGPSRHLACAGENPGLGEMNLPWVAQDPGGPAPWVSAATRDKARDSVVAQGIGYARVSALFREFADARND